MDTRSLESLIDTNLKAWSEADETKRMAILENCWNEEGTYADPIQHIEGREALTRGAAVFQQRRPAERFARAGPVYAHHG